MVLVPLALPQQAAVTGTLSHTGVSMSVAPNLVYVQHISGVAEIREVGNPVMADAGYNLLAKCVLPEGDQSLPLGDHLLLATVEKIWKGNVIFHPVFPVCFPQTKVQSGNVLAFIHCPQWIFLIRACPIFESDTCCQHKLFI